MNEQIQKLWEQSAQRDDIWNQARHEKFAELIIRECADVAYKYNRCDWADVSKSIKEHFGVEE